MNSQQYKIIIPTDARPLSVEISVARILANYFRADVEFIATSQGQTPDFMINDQMWELKSPRGNGKHTIEHQLNRASKQAKNIILDLRRMKMRANKAIREAKRQILPMRGIRRAILILPDEKVLKIK